MGGALPVVRVKTPIPFCVEINVNLTVGDSPTAGLRTCILKQRPGNRIGRQSERAGAKAVLISMGL